MGNIWLGISLTERKKVMENIKYKDFCDDAEKMVDFFQLSKEEFLESYSYMTEEEYLLTSIKIKEKSNGK